MKELNKNKNLYTGKLKERSSIKYKKKEKKILINGKHLNIKDKSKIIHQITSIIS